MIKMPAGLWDTSSVCALMCKTIIALSSRHQKQWGRMTQKINILNNPDIRDSWQENVFDYRRHFGKVSVVVNSCQNCKWPWKDQFWWSCVRGKKIAVSWWEKVSYEVGLWNDKENWRNNERNVVLRKEFFWMGNIRPSILPLQVKCGSLTPI